MKAEITYREATLSGVRFLLCLNTGLLLSWRCTDIDMLAVAGLWGYTCKWPSHERGRERSGLLVVGTRKRWMQGKRGAVCCRHSQRQRGAWGSPSPLAEEERKQGEKLLAVAANDWEGGRFSGGVWDHSWLMCIAKSEEACCCCRTSYCPVVVLWTVREMKKKKTTSPLLVLLCVDLCCVLNLRRCLLDLLLVCWLILA